jgi:hypothetical protein
MALRATTFLTLADLKTWCGITPGTAKSVSSITRVGTTATVVCQNHGCKNQDTVDILGAGQTEYNGYQTITIVDANTFTFTVTGSPATPATGTITARCENDLILTRTGDRVSEQIERATARIFKKREDVTETINGNGRAALYLKYFPIIGTPVVELDGDEVDDSLYVIEADRGCLRMKGVGVWPAGVGNLVATYDAGYEDDDIPADVIGLGLDIAKFLYERRDKTIASSAIAVGGSNVSFIPGLPIDLRTQLTQLRDTRGG